jgi:hypothetical protein
MNQQGHYRAALWFGRLNRMIGVPTIVLTAIVGTSAFSSLTEARQVSPEWQLVAGILSLLAAALASLLTFFRFPERAVDHRRASAAFGNIRREIEQLLTRDFDADQGEEINERLTEIRKAIDDADANSAEVPNSIWRRTYKGLKNSKPPPMQD